MRTTLWRIFPAGGGVIAALLSVLGVLITQSVRGLSAQGVRAQPVPVEFAGYAPKTGVKIIHQEDHLRVVWPMAGTETGSLTFDLRAGHPLIESLRVAAHGGTDGKTDRETDAPALLHSLDPAFFLTVGTRVATSGRPPEMSFWNEFFDSPNKRPHETYRSRLALKRVRVTGEGQRASVVLGDLSLGSFVGELVFTFYAGSRLFQMEAVVATQEDRRALCYDAGLVGDASGWQQMAWVDTEGRWQHAAVPPSAPNRPLAVRYRTLLAETDRGCLACLPPPHQFFFPRDLTDNLKTVWFGRGHLQETDAFGFGIRQSPDGGGNYAPWFNAPPGTRQRLGLFFMLQHGSAPATLQEALRYTHGDRFPTRPGCITFTSHWHMAVAVAAMERKARGLPQSVPDFVRVFTQMGVQAVHLAEFHGDGHPLDPGPLRLPEMEAMFAECRRLANPVFLPIPGEEINGVLGAQHTGHWMSLFPKPVYFTQRRTAEQPFVEQIAPYGTVYHIGGAADMQALLTREHGLGWVAHPRIKASSWIPDSFHTEAFYLADTWLGAAWKAMPADLSRPKLGERALDLLDTMANWGQRKYLPGEVDVFKIDHTHELYGHMNINYLRLNRLPRFDEGWQPILDALRAGRFFTTTGEILLDRFTVGGKASGETCALDPDGRANLHITLDWTFPLQFAEIVSGDGQQVYRERIPLAETRAFGKRTLQLRPDLKGRTWVRFEVWDVATNGAFTQPVWLTPLPEHARGRPPSGLRKKGSHAFSQEKRHRVPS